MGLPLFFLLKDSAGTSLAAMVMIAVMLPCFLVAMYEKHGQPLEVVVKNIIQTKFIAAQRATISDRKFICRLRDGSENLEKEVSAIVKRQQQQTGGGKRARLTRSAS